MHTKPRVFGNIHKLLIANRGEIALRIAAAAAELGIATVAVFSEDDAESLHPERCDEAVALSGVGPAPYLDIGQILDVAIGTGCQAVHPGYGFLSENADFARRCRDAGLIFIGPDPETLELFGDKVRARSFARDHHVPIPAGTFRATDAAEAERFFASLPAGRGMMVKALAGGGGRGMRPVQDAAEIRDAFTVCAAEAHAAFGNGSLYVEELVPQSRHVEIQVIGDGSNAPIVLGERECSLQRRNQKVIEIAPAPNLPAVVRNALADAARRMAAAVCYQGLGTFEFLVPLEQSGASHPFYFIEANPRLQVEHTVTDQVFGVDLVKAQIRIAAGASLADVGLNVATPPSPRGYAIQCRINLESIDAKANVTPAGGRIDVYEAPSGIGIRVDGSGYAGYVSGLRFDTLLAKLIAFSVGDEDLPAVLRRAARALDGFVVGGVATNISFLRNVLDRPEIVAGTTHTRFIDDHIADLAGGRPRRPPRRRPAVAFSSQAPAATPIGEGEIPVYPVTAGAVVELHVAEGDVIAPGRPIATLEAMKMQTVIESPVAGRVTRIFATLGSIAQPQDPLLALEPMDAEDIAASGTTENDLDTIRADLAALFARRYLTTDEARPTMVERRHALGKRTARENLNQLCDPGSFIEYGGLAIAAQRTRRAMDDLIRNTPADGVITGLGQINADQFGPEDSSCVVVAYDYSVLAGTQGYFNHKKQDRIFQLASKLMRPIVMYAEGGGGRPGDTDKDILQGGGVGSPTFAAFGRLSGLVPMVGVVSGRCFAGNAALVGCCDVVIATEDANLGMAGPAMIEGGGLGVFRSEEIGPAAMHDRAGTIDVLVKDEIEATQMARKYLGYFQGNLTHWSCVDQRLLRYIVPENRKKAFDMRRLIAMLADDGSVLELRPRFGTSLITAFVRIEGRPMGMIANNSAILGGALDADASVKGARMARLCDAFDLPLVALLDTPGFMVGPDAELDAFVRKACGLFVTGANLDIPVFTVIIRKSYGLGAQATAAGHLMGSSFCVAWPTGELGGMGFEGAVRLAYRKELAALADPAQREAEFERLVGEMYMRGSALNAATVQEVDDVIDPAETRRWITGLMHAFGSARRDRSKKRASVPTW